MEFVIFFIKGWCKMRKYKVTAYIWRKTHSKVIEAKNSVEANKKIDYGHKMSNYGNGSFFRGVSVKSVKK